MIRFVHIIIMVLVAAVSPPASTALADVENKSEPYWIYKAIYDQDFDLADDRIEQSKIYGSSGAQRAFFEGLMASMEWTNRYDYKLAVTKLNQALNAGIPNAGSVLATLIERISINFCTEFDKHGIDKNLLLESLKSNFDYDSPAFRQFVKIQSICLGKNLTDPVFAAASTTFSKDTILFESTLNLVRLTRSKIDDESGGRLFVEAISDTYFDAEFGIPYSQWSLGLSLRILGQAVGDKAMLNEGNIWLRLAVLSGEYSEDDFAKAVGSDDANVDIELLNRRIKVRAATEISYSGVPIESYGCKESHKLYYQCVAQAGVDLLYCWQPRYTDADGIKHFDLSVNTAYHLCRRHRMAGLLKN